jgi:hypothetical protein
MERMPETLLRVAEYRAEGYAPIVDFANWRVAVLNYIDELEPDRIDSMQRHDETDEVFVLLRGRCILFLGEGKDRLGAIRAADMEPLKAYNVKRGAWHTHALDREGSVLIVENRDTSDANSPKIALDAAQRGEIAELARKAWKLP